MPVTNPPSILDINGTPEQIPVNGSIVANAGTGSFYVYNASTGSTAPLTPVFTAGADANNVVRGIVTDATGRQISVGAAASGSPAIGNPIQTGGTDGTDARAFMTDTLGVGVVANIAWAATIGRISGSIAGHRFGFDSIGGNLASFRATAYIEQTSAARRSVSSTNANDTSAGTGAQQITITYYDNNMNGPITEVLSLNGTTAVNTVNTNIQYIESITVSRVGSNASNLGTISLFAGTGGTGATIGSIGFGLQATGFGDNQTLWAHHYVRPGKTCYILAMSWAVTGISSGGIYIKFINPLTSTNVELQVTPQFGSRYLSGDYVFRCPIPCVGPGRVTMYIESSGGVEVMGSFEFMEF
jgi:hypothetical protein